MRVSVIIVNSCNKYNQQNCAAILIMVNNQYGWLFSVITSLQTRDSAGFPISSLFTHLFYLHLLMFFLPFPECTFWDTAIFFKHLYELMSSLEIIRDSVGSQPPPV